MCVFRLRSSPNSDPREGLSASCQHRSIQLHAREKEPLVPRVTSRRKSGWNSNPPCHKISPGAIIKRTVVLVASLRSLNCGFRFSLRFSARNAHFSYPRMTVSPTVVREETKERKRQKEKRNLKQKKAFNDTLSFQINIITVYLAFVLGLYLVGVKKKKKKKLSHAQ